MIQCADCELFVDGVLTCDPSANIKEPECLLKWQVVKLCCIETHLELQTRLLPLTEQILQRVGGEIVERDEADDWKCGGHG